MTSFYGDIKSYDIHTYWHASSPAQAEFAAQLRQKVLDEFAPEVEAGDIRVYKLWDKAIGPHPTCMFEIDFSKPEVFAKIVPFYQMNHGSLSVLIHPRTGNDLLDHTQNALWLGHKLRLNTEYLH
ncbi:hypothetical protein PSN45_002575 [Yamadazyma tenuis]|uniref:Dopa 4,5-dioxygenase n=1 Tax=Candida tenuis (strain ATCC 10573 / BCRC 21748 / CBS 615 / JCM 9827 / NBRC 10315 / NRRL Y-1498 / VKM Y-70) TaxID=590646 RepID=G3AZZ6_CANTC|nr:dopa 4,5-dioxygenase [Yamadazyma tenuis ATCC 10573]XP_006685175.1 uncharacterized protein CANTEDRAFT_113017 [Yamadazyma tenuis ATCC 10573]EGV65488.1 dopa 4,5-dioxygenase [Yamadazyma tenuis ATCC 10573]EGV65489.1 hypothetical protein CANTEDRAFT_113017 [Yamadazyma tenuis ATCC 10573]WEJ95066.1 hypothetical protein PSN45_002575 [Yamadazyma tenuis]